MEPFDGPVAAVGDFNWKGCYERCTPVGFRVVESRPTTLIGTAPSRAVVRGQALHSATHFLPGFPHHGLALFDWEAPFVLQRRVRLRRTARFEWGDPSVLVDGEHELFREVNRCAPVVAGPLSAKLQRWHLRAELLLELAARAGIAECLTKGERPKGSCPDSRAKGHGAQARKGRDYHLAEISEDAPAIGGEAAHG